MNNYLHKIVFCLIICWVTLISYAESKISIRGGAFVPTSSRFMKIYGATGNVQLEGATKLHEHIEFWSNIDWFSKCGHSIGLRNPTKISSLNYSFGLKFPYEFLDGFLPYIGIGPSFGGIRITNNSVCGREKILRTAVGIVIKTGSYWNLNEHTFFDIYADYLYQPVHFQSLMNVGGFKFGIGLGYRY